MRPNRLALLFSLAVLAFWKSDSLAAATDISQSEPTFAAKTTETSVKLNKANLLTGLRLGPQSEVGVTAKSGVTETTWIPLGTPTFAAPRSNQGQFYNQQNCWQLMPEGLIYRPYLANTKESRFRSVWHNDKSAGNIWDITLGGQVGILRYGSSGNGRPTGWQLGIEGAGLVRLDLDENNDVMASDFRFGIPLTWGDELVQYKFGYYHLSSHVGDEFMLKNVGFTRYNFSRDVMVMGVSISPRERWRVYSEMGYAFRSDVSKEWEFQFGLEYGPEGATGRRGEPFAAVHGHLREEVDFGGNFVSQMGWAWRRSAASGMFRMGVEYYNGKNEQFSFFKVDEQKVGFGMWYDY